MCEVEFWEVFKEMYKGFLNGYLRPFVDCRIANLDDALIVVCCEPNY